MHDARTLVPAAVARSSDDSHQSTDISVVLTVTGRKTLQIYFALLSRY